MSSKINQYGVDFFTGKKKITIAAADLTSSHSLLHAMLTREKPFPYRLVRCHIYINGKRGDRQWEFKPGK